MADFDFNAPYVDRRTWIIDHLQDLVLEPKEILVVLLIDFFNQQHISIDHELISEKLKISVDEVEDIFTELSDKGYLTLDYADGSSTSSTLILKESLNFQIQTIQPLIVLY